MISFLSCDFLTLLISFIIYDYNYIESKKVIALDEQAYRMSFYALVLGLWAFLLSIVAIVVTLRRGVSSSSGNGSGFVIPQGGSRGGYNAVELR